MSHIIAVTKFKQAPEGALDNSEQFYQKPAARASSGGDVPKEANGTFKAARDAATRRPTRGFQLKSDTPATISVLDAAGVGRELYNSSAKDGSRVSFTTNFLVQSVDIPRSEKMQLVQTFGPTYGFFFGEQPIFLQVSALVLDSEDFPWAAEWWANYDENLRGTRLVDRGVQVYFEIEDFVYAGYLTSSRQGKAATSLLEVPISMSMWVTSITMKTSPGLRGLAAYESGPGAEEFTLAPSNELGEYVSATADVRAANFEQATQFNLLGWLRSSLDTAESFLNNAIQDGRNVLYGRNVRVPAGFAGSDINAGPATFASGSGFEKALQTGLVTVRLPPEFSVKTSVTPRGSFYDNIDEYPFRGAVESQESADKKMSDMFSITRPAGAYAVDPKTGDLVPKSSTDVVAIAEQRWKSAGFPNVSNDEGAGLPEWALALSRVAFGVSSFPLGLGADVLASRLQPGLNTTDGDAVLGTAADGSPILGQKPSTGSLITRQQIANGLGARGGF